VLFSSQLNKSGTDTAIAKAELQASSINNFVTGCFSGKVHRIDTSQFETIDACASEMSRVLLQEKPFLRLNEFKGNDQDGDEEPPPYDDEPPPVFYAPPPNDTAPNYNAPPVYDEPPPI
jgi:hypothetical protein